MKILTSKKAGTISVKTYWRALIRTNHAGETICPLKNLSGLRELEIKEDPTVRVLARDKNLGLALISTEWIEKETLKHLNDTKSYSKVTLDDWTFRRHKVIETREKLVQLLSFSTS